MDRLTLAMKILEGTHEQRQSFGETNPADSAYFDPAFIFHRFDRFRGMDILVPDTFARYELVEMIRIDKARIPQQDENMNVHIVRYRQAGTTAPDPVWAS